MKKRKGLITILIIVLILIIWAVLRISSKYTLSNGAPAGSIVAVETKRVETGNVKGKIFYTGNIEGINEATVISQTSGTIEKVFAEVGKKCSAGDILVVIENEQQKAGVEQAKAQVLLAETNHEKAAKDLQRTEKLFSETVATKDNLELAQLNVKSALAQLKGAQAALKVSEKQLNDTHIKATISGRVASRDVNLGGTVAPGTKIAIIVNNSKVKVKILVSETDVVNLKPLQSVSVQIDALPGREFEGKINTIGFVTEQSGRSYAVEVIMNNPGDGEIKSGMFARCSIITETRENVIVVPEKAVIINTDGSTQIFVVENGKSKLKQIKIGIKSDDRFEVTSGLNLNEKIVITGKERLINGAEVMEGLK